MIVLDLDIDYFMNLIASTPESISERLPEDVYKECVWKEDKVRNFFEVNLGLSKHRKISGRIITGHNEAIDFWKELIYAGKLTVPFEVIHIDSHADLGLGFDSDTYILDHLLKYSVESRPNYNNYVDFRGHNRNEGIGDYLLFAVAYQWISKLTYCANPNGDKNDYFWYTLKDFKENKIWDDPVENTIQLLHNPDMDIPNYIDDDFLKQEYIKNSVKEPEVPFLIIPTIEAVQYDGSFDYIVVAQSPNYTPTSADFIVDMIKEYIYEI